MSRYRMFRKQAGAWAPQNTLGFHFKAGGVWKLVENVFEKQAGSWVKVYDAAFDSDFESDLADGESITVSSIGTLRITARGKTGNGGNGGKGGDVGPIGTKRIQRLFIPLTLRRIGGAGGGGGGGGRSTGALAVSDVLVNPGDVISRNDSATHVRIYHDSDLVVSAENGQAGANGANGASGAAGKGAKGGEGGDGGAAGRSSQSVGNVSTADGITGTHGKTGASGQTPDWPRSAFYLTRGTPGAGGQGFPNSGRTGSPTGNFLQRGFDTNEEFTGDGGDGGLGQVVPPGSSCTIEAI